MKMMHEQSSAKILEAARILQHGGGILLHDSSARENEVDLVFSAVHCRPENIAFMRTFAGGLICSAIGNEVADRIGLPFMHDLLAGISADFPILSSIVESATPYGGKPAFSITLNHRNSFTGVTDNDRSATISAIGSVAEMVSRGDPNAAAEFASTLKSPGHVQLLIEARGALGERKGHTELSIRLMRIAGLPPATALCEMLDSRTHSSLRLEDAALFARDNDLLLIEGHEIL